MVRFIRTSVPQNQARTRGPLVVEELLGWEQSRFLLIVTAALLVSFLLLREREGFRSGGCRQERLLATRRISFGISSLSTAGDPASVSHRTAPFLLREVWERRGGSALCCSAFGQNQDNEP